MEDLKLNLGCGNVKLAGYINMDYADVKPDRTYDLSEPLDYPDNSIDEISSYHMFEHLPFQCIEKVVTSWYKQLKPGGKLIMEMPDFDGVVQQLIERPNDNTVLASVFGSQDRAGQFHHWGWNKTRLKLLLEGVGFAGILFPPPIDYHKDLEPCLRVEATK